MYFKILYRKIVNFFFPVECVYCNKPNTILCSDCVFKVPPPYTHNLPKDTFALFSYKDNRIRRIIRKLKYSNHHFYAKDLGVYMADFLIGKFEDEMILGIDIILVPIPLSNKNKRLHNHAEVLAKVISLDRAHFNVEKIIIRKKKTIQQAKIKNRKKRIENIRGAFAISERIKRSAGENNKSKIPKNAIFVIVDDVATTGATIDEARRVIHTHFGNRRKIFAITVAH